MAVIACPECQKDISTRAAACSHCGCPLGVAVSDSTAPPTTIRAERDALLARLKIGLDRDSIFPESSVIVVMLRKLRFRIVGRKAWAIEWLKLAKLSSLEFIELPALLLPGLPYDWDADRRIREDLQRRLPETIIK